jgi:arylsulfatase A-like enzyme
MKTFLLFFLISFSALAQEKPNIIFIFSDDHASEAISAYDSHLKDYAKTPNIDRIANEGILFRNTFCNNSICSPSRAAVMTGQYSHVNGVLNLNGKIRPESPFFTEELQKNDYQTWLVGKWHIHSKPRGFDKCKVVHNQGEYFDPVFYNDEFKKIEEVKGYSSDVYTDVALKWLDQRDTKKPFCLLLNFKAPHHDYQFPARHKDLLKDAKIPEPTNLYEDVPNGDSHLKKAFLKESKFHMSRVGKDNDYYERHQDEMEPHDANDNKDKWRVAYQHMLKTYIRCVTAVDENIGRVLDYLDQQKLADNTIVIYSSDQGYWLGQHGFYDKRLALEQSLRMPLVMRYPKLIKAGSENKNLCSNIDFAPTILDLAGVKIPTAIQGTSLKPLLNGQAQTAWRNSAYYRYYAQPKHSALRTERYAFIEIDGKYELYDIKNDPTQMKNIADSPENKILIEDLKKKKTQYEQNIGYSAELVKSMNHGNGRSKKKK